MRQIPRGYLIEVPTEAACLDGGTIVLSKALRKKYNCDRHQHQFTDDEALDMMKSYLVLQMIKSVLITTNLAVTFLCRYGWFPGHERTEEKDPLLDYRYTIDPEIKLAIEMLRMTKNMRK